MYSEMLTLPARPNLRGPGRKSKRRKKRKREKGTAGFSPPAGLPPLTKAYRLHSKAAQAGFTWDEEEDVERQIESEWLELLDARASGDETAKEHELGDMLFSLVELGRRMGIKAAHALDMADNRFRRRFEAMEKLAKERGRDFAALDLDAKDDLWNEVKEQETSSGSSGEHHVPFVSPSAVSGESGK